MDDLVEFENRAGLARITCGWRKTHLEQDSVRRYWRDVHSPAIARRAGLFEYRHSPFDAVREDFFGPIEGIEQRCALDAQLHWQSDVRYLDEAALVEFGASPDGVVKSHLLADIDLLVDRSTTYRAVGRNARTFLDRTGNPVLVGLVQSPTYAVFFRQRGDENSFRAGLTTFAQSLAQSKHVLRIRLNLFDVPDMEAEKKAGYPIKTHPDEQQYQAFMELVLLGQTDPSRLLATGQKNNLVEIVRTIHAYSVPAVYTFVYRARPTLVGLRGFAAYEAINAIGATNQRQPILLEWMYGPVVQGGPIVPGVE